MSAPAQFQAMPALEKSRLLCVGCMIHVQKEPSNPRTASNISSCGSWQILLPSVTMYSTNVGPYHINPQQLQFGVGHNFELPCQHLHPSVIRANEIILEVIIIITWQNVHNRTIETHYGHHYTKKLTHSTLLFTSMIISIANLAKKK